MPTDESPWDPRLWRGTGCGSNARPERPAQRPAQRGRRPAPAPMHWGGDSGRLRRGPGGLQGVRRQPWTDHRPRVGKRGSRRQRQPELPPHKTQGTPRRPPWACRPRGQSRRGGPGRDKVPRGCAAPQATAGTHAGLSGAEGAALTWGEVLAMPGGVHQHVRVEGGVESLVGTAGRRRVS